MPTVEDYVARIEETCGAEKSAVVTFKYDKKDEAIARISQRATLKSSVAGVISEYTYQEISFRVYSSGKAIFKEIRNKSQLYTFLSALLL